MSETLFAIAAAVLVLFTPVMPLLAQKDPQPGETALVIAAPWGPALSEIVSRAQAPRVAPVDASLAALVALKDADSIARLRAEGAWLVVRGDLLLELCSG